MKAILINIGVFFAALIVGGMVNMGLVIAGPMLIASPNGVDVTDIASIAASIHLFEIKHFVFPFLAHAVGTLVGAVLAYKFAFKYRKAMAYLVGGVFLLAGIANTFMIPAPTWFVVLDLLAAYIPMAWLGIQISQVSQTN